MSNFKYQKLESPKFREMVKARGRITLGEAKKHAISLPPEQQGKVSGCRIVRCPESSKCCAGRCIGCAFPIQCCSGFLWTPGCSIFCVDFVVGMWFGQCRDKQSIFCSEDLKGNIYHFVKVDGEDNTWAWFSANECIDSRGENTPVTCYCEQPY